MKKLAVASLLALATSVATAAMEKIASIQIDNTTALMRSAGKFGELIGNPAAAGFVGSLLLRNPVIETFGPMRTDENSTAVLSLFLDEEKIDSQVECSGYTLVYPAVGGKEAFLKRHADAVVTNSVVSFADGGTTAFVAFSADGKWLAKGASPESAQAALADVALASQKLDGAAVKMVIGEKGMRSFGRMFSEKLAKEIHAKDGKCMGLNEFDEMLKSLVSAELKLAVSDRGLDIVGWVTTVKGSELAKLACKPLSANACAGFAKGAVFAEAYADDMGCNQQDTVKCFRVFVKMLKEFGFDVDKFIKLTEKGSDITYAFDVKSLMSMTMSTNGFDLAEFVKSDRPEKLVERLSAAFEPFQTNAFKVASKGFRQQLVINGYEAPFTVEARLAATIPEFKTKPVANVAFVSYYSILKAVLPQVIADLPEERKAEIQPLLSLLPAEGKGGMAAFCWREGDRLSGLFRVSSDELKNWGACFNSYMTYAMMAGQEDDDDEEDDDDGEDSDDGE